MRLKCSSLPVDSSEKGVRMPVNLYKVLSLEIVKTLVFIALFIFVRPANAFTQWALSYKNAIGVNYFHLHKGLPYDTFDTFDPGVYDTNEADKVLREIERSKFAFVRIWLTGIYVDDNFGHQLLNQQNEYIQNIANFINLAKSHHLYLVLTVTFKNDKPPSCSASTRYVGMNALLLDDKMSDCLADFYAKTLRSLRQAGADLNRIFYIDIYNELHFDLSLSPFRDQQQSSAELSRRLATINDAFLRFAKKINNSIKSIDKGVPTTISSFPNSEFGRSSFSDLKRSTIGESLYPISPDLLMKAHLDLVDIHLYPTPKYSSYNAEIVRMMRSNGISAGGVAAGLPLVVGEIGMLRSLYPTIYDAEDGLRNSLSTLCGLQVYAWTVWMWDGPGNTWSLRDQNGRLNKAIAPGSKEAKIYPPCIRKD